MNDGRRRSKLIVSVGAIQIFSIEYHLIRTEDRFYFKLNEQFQLFPILFLFPHRKIV